MSHIQLNSNVQNNIRLRMEFRRDALPLLCRSVRVRTGRPRGFRETAERGDTYGGLQKKNAIDADSEVLFQKLGIPHQKCKYNQPRPGIEPVHIENAAQWKTGRSRNNPTSRTGFQMPIPPPPTFLGKMPAVEIEPPHRAQIAQIPKADHYPTRPRGELFQ